MCPVLELPQKPQSLASTQQQSCGPLCQSKHKKEWLKLRVHVFSDWKKKIEFQLVSHFSFWGHLFPILANNFVYRGSETVFLHLLFYKLVKLLNPGHKCVLDYWTRNFLSPAKTQLISANPRLNCNPNFFFFCSKAFSLIISVFFRVSNLPIVDKMK